MGYHPDFVDEAKRRNLKCDVDSQSQNKITKNNACENGYFKYGDACLRIPDNAFAFGDHGDAKMDLNR